MYVTVDVVHVRILGLAIWAHNPIVVKEFDWCPAEVARCAFFDNVKSHNLIIAAGCGRDSWSVSSKDVVFSDRDISYRVYEREVLGSE